jgi:hypothetical protein
MNIGALIGIILAVMIGVIIIPSIVDTVANVTEIANEPIATETVIEDTGTDTGQQTQEGGSILLTIFNTGMATLILGTGSYAIVKRNRQRNELRLYKGTRPNEPEEKAKLSIFGIRIK